MADNSALVITTRVDVSQLRTGMAEASAAVSASTKQMTASFNEATVASQAAFQDIAESLSKDVIPATTKLKEEMADAGKVTAHEMMEARHALHGLGAEIGVHLPRYLQTFVAGLGGVAPFMAAAFSTIAVIGLLQLLPELVNKIKEAGDAAMGFGEKQKKAYDEALAANQKLIISNLELAEKYDSVGVRGAAGLKKITLDIENNRKATEDAAGAQRANAKNLHDAVSQYQDIDTVFGRFTTSLKMNNDLAQAAVYWWMLDNKTIAEAEERAKNLSKAQEEVNAKLRDKLAIDAANLAQDKKNESATNVESMASAQIAVHKTIIDAKLAADDAYAKELQALGIYTAEQVKAVEESNEVQRNAALITSIEKKKALLTAEHARTGKEVAAEIEALNAQEEAALIAHQAKMAAIDSTYAAQKMQKDQSVSLATIDGDKKIEDLRATNAKESATQLYELHKISAAEETTLLIDAENARYTAEKKNLNGHLTELQKDQEKNSAAIKTIEKDLEAAILQNQNNIQTIKTTGNAKSLADYKQKSDEEARVAIETANMKFQSEQQMNNRMLQSRGESLSQWYQNETTYINQWYDAHHKALEKELNDARTIYGENSIAYRKLIDEMNKLDLERAQKQKATSQEVHDKLLSDLRSIDSGFKSSVTGWIEGQNSFADVVRSLWQGLTSAILNQIFKIAEEWITTHILMKVFGMTTSETASRAQIMNSAAAGAAAAAASVAAIPYVGWEMAPEVFGTTYGMLISAEGLMAEKGGLMGSDAMVHVHEREMILPPHLSDGIQGLIAGGGGRSNGMSVHFSPQVSAIDAKGVEEFFHTHGSTLARKLGDLVRAGAMAPALKRAR